MFSAVFSARNNIENTFRQNGQNIVEKSETIFSSVNDTMLKDFSELEKELLIQFFDRICENLNEEGGI